MTTLPTLRRRIESLEQRAEFETDAHVAAPLRMVRPKEYRAEYCALLIEDAARGFSLAAFAATVPCAYSTLQRWAAEHPEFRAAVEVAKATRLRVLEKRVLAQGISGPEATVRLRALANLMPATWRDRSEADVSFGAVQDKHETTVDRVSDMTPEQAYAYVMRGAALPVPAREIFKSEPIAITADQIKAVGSRGADDVG